MITPERLGSSEFKKNYRTKYAYAAGSMYKGIASKELVIRMGKANLLSFLGTGGLKMEILDEGIREIKAALGENHPYGCNLLHQPEFLETEMALVQLLFQYQVRSVEAAAFMQITPSLVWYRLKGIKRLPQGEIEIPNSIIAKISRPEVATAFMSPAPREMVEQLVASGKLSQTEAELGSSIPIAHDICVESDSGGHTDQGVALALMPAIQSLRKEMMEKYHYDIPIRIGAAGGIGTPEAAAAAFILGADFVVTGSINQCTVEAGTSDAVKDILQTLNVQDTTYAPAGDMFEIGAKVQVARKGVLFPARANKLFELYRQYDSIDAIDEKTKEQIQTRYFQRNFQDVWQETRTFYQRIKPDILAKAEHNLKHKMALIFRWYFVHSTRLAMKGIADQRVDFQIHCGPAMGAFNQWVKGTELENWHNRHADQIAEKIMQETADLLNKRFAQWQ